MASQRKDGEKVTVPKTAAERQRFKLEKLMKNPNKPVVIPEPQDPKLPRVFKPPEFIRNIWGSSAGAGSGDFHVYRGVRRRENARQKFLDEKAVIDQKADNYKKKVEVNQKEAEERTSKKRAKRLKKKAKQKAAKKQKTTKTKEEESSEDDNSDEEEAAAAQNDGDSVNSDDKQKPDSVSDSETKQKANSDNDSGRESDSDQKEDT